MREVTVKQTDGASAKRLQPETEQERRELSRRHDLAPGGIDARRPSPYDWSDE